MTQKRPRCHQWLFGGPTTHLCHVIGDITQGSSWKLFGSICRTSQSPEITAIKDIMIGHWRGSSSLPSLLIQTDSWFALTRNYCEIKATEGKKNKNRCTRLKKIKEYKEEKVKKKYKWEKNLHTMRERRKRAHTNEMVKYRETRHQTMVWANRIL